jgi:hypothetical protein
MHICILFGCLYWVTGGCFICVVTTADCDAYGHLCQLTLDLLEHATTPRCQLKFSSLMDSVTTNYHHTRVLTQSMLWPLRINPNSLAYSSLVRCWRVLHVLPTCFLQFAHLSCSLSSIACLVISVYHRCTGWNGCCIRASNYNACISWLAVQATSRRLTDYLTKDNQRDVYRTACSRYLAADT